MELDGEARLISFGLGVWLALVIVTAGYIALYLPSVFPGWDFSDLRTLSYKSDVTLMCLAALVIGLVASWRLTITIRKLYRWFSARNHS